MSLRKGVKCYTFKLNVLSLHQIQIKHWRQQGKHGIKIMKFSELPAEVQAQLNKQREELKRKRINDPYNILLYNEEGTRYFYARRICESWNNDKGAYMPFGGGSHWNIWYGKVQFERFRNPVGEIDYRLCDGKTYGKSVNGTVIPVSVDTKKEVISIIKAIGIFNL